MHIEFSQEGGLAYLPELSKPSTIDVKTLGAGDGEDLQRLIDDARFFELPADVGAAPRGAADYQHYTLTIKDGGREHTVRMLVPIQDPALEALVRAVRKAAKAQRAASRTAASSTGPGERK